MKTYAHRSSLDSGRGPSRRHILRAAGVSLALPSLAAFSASAAPVAVTRRMLAICNNLGMVPRRFFPTAQGIDYPLSPYLEHLRELRSDFTVFSGLSHPDVDGGHPAENCFLTAAPHPAGGGFRNSISLDQYAAQYIGHLTRLSSLTLGVNQDSGQRSLSWTAGGVLIPCEQKPSQVYARLFLRGDPREVHTQLRRIERGRSIMDTVGEQARQLARDLGPRDRERLDQFSTGVREMEARLVRAQQWEDVPRPVVRSPAPVDLVGNRNYLGKVRLMYDMARLAFETDSTRLITLMLDGVDTPPLQIGAINVKDSYHNLSHHGRDEGKLGQLEAIEHEHMKLLAGLLGDLKRAPEGESSLLDRTMVLFGSNMGDANSHVTTNLPVLLAGGGFKHGHHLVFDPHRNYPLPNLFVSMLQRMGLGTDRFASSTGPMRGLISSPTA